MSNTIISIRNLRVYYKIKTRDSLFAATRTLKAVDDVSLEIEQGETLGIVGESGCGKSTLCRAMVGLEKPTSGEIILEDKDIARLNRKQRFEMCKRVQMIFQDAYSTLDPRFTIGRSIGEPLEVQHNGTKEEQKERVLKLLEDVGLPRSYYNRFPHEFSGGQRQRIGIARALALNPDIILCDEPVSALDVSIQAQILNLMKDLQAKYNLTYVFVSHNLSVVKHLCSRIAVMYLGTIVELANQGKLFSNPLHPYTRALIQAIPVADPDYEGEMTVLEGDVPSPMNPPDGCPFVTRCPYAKDICEKERPKLHEIQPEHFVACHFAGEV